MGKRTTKVRKILATHSTRRTETPAMKSKVINKNAWESHYTALMRRNWTPGSRWERHHPKRGLGVGLGCRSAGHVNQLSCNYY